MAKTYLDQLVEYPAQIVTKIASDDKCVGLIENKKFSDVGEDDFDNVLERNIFNYQYVDETTNESSAYVWVEIDINSVDNQTIKNARLYVTVACHKNYMKLSPSLFKGILGNRRDNLVRYIDKILNNSDIIGIGRLKLMSVKTIAPISGFTIKEITYSVPDFNIVDINE